MMAHPAKIKEMETSMAKEPALGSHMPSQEHLVVTGMMEHESWPSGAHQRRQKVEAKVAGFPAGQPVWNTSAARPKKVLPAPRMLREQGFVDAHSQQYPGSFQVMRSRHDCNIEVDGLAEIGMEGLSEVEMEVMRKQLRTVTWRLNVLEEESATWCYREVLVFVMLVLACIINLWLWLHQ